MLNNTIKKNSKRVIGLSFDVEDWFTVRNMRDFYKPEEWDGLELRVHIGLEFILLELKKRKITATFFILGWIAKKCPDIVHAIDLAGHEICCHGHYHIPLDLLTPKSFEDDLKMSIDTLENITGKKVKGFRAPSFSVTKNTMWAIKILKNNGIEYDSSIFSTIHPDYGIDNFPKGVTDLGEILEVPLTQGHFFGTTIPVCGGGYFRMLPYPLIKSSLKQTLKNDSLVMYFHPWEFDPKQPKIKLSPLKRFRHYTGLNSNRDKFIKLLNDFEFTSIENLIKGEKVNGAFALYQ